MPWISTNYFHILRPGACNWTVYSATGGLLSTVLLESSFKAAVTERYTSQNLKYCYISEYFWQLAAVQSRKHLHQGKETLQWTRLPPILLIPRRGWRWSTGGTPRYFSSYVNTCRFTSKSKMQKAHFTVSEINQTSCFLQLLQITWILEAMFHWCTDALQLRYFKSRTKLVSPKILPLFNLYATDTICNTQNNKTWIVNMMYISVIFSIIHQKV